MVDLSELTRDRLFSDPVGFLTELSGKAPRSVEEAGALLGGLDSLVSSILVCLAICALCFVLSLLTGNCSWVDRLWSVTPPFFVWWFALVRGQGVDGRLALMCLLSLLWGARLTYNFARKGGYKLSEEDYRWPYLRRKIPWPLFLLFNLTFISTYQNVLLLWLATPAYVVASNPGAPLNAVDAAAALLWILLFIGEVVADQQQWNFQQAKRQAQPPLKDDLKLGFITRGLFRYSRHPNFFCEFNLWFAFYLFSVAATGQIFNWSLLGYLQLLLLFQGSTNFTESISASKYPQYAKYQKTTSRLIPWFPGPTLY